MRLPNVDPASGRELGIVDMLLRQATERPEQVFVRTATDSVTYAEMAQRSSRLAGALDDLGLRRGDAAALMMDNSVEQVVVWFALASLGVLHVPLNTALLGAGLRHVLEVSRPSAVVVDERHRERLHECGALTPGTHVVVHGTSRGDLALTELMQGGRPHDPVTAEPLEAATLMFTSGTTGPSKACVLSRRYLAAQGAAHSANFRLQADDVLYCPFPLFHIDAATLTTVAALSVGATAALGERFSARGFWHEVRHFDASVFNFMGATLSILWKQPAGDSDTEHRVRLAWGVPMPSWQRAWEQRFGFPLYQVYGSTDAGVPVYDPVDGSQRPGACGRVTPSYEVRIDRSPVGEILVRGRQPGLTMSGYFGMPEATSETIDPDAWVHTGDLGSLDDDYLTFHGRLSDSIRRRGENISAHEVESAVTEHPDVLEAAAIGVPSELTEEDVKVCVVLRPGAALDARSLRDHLLRSVPRHMVPRYYEIVDNLPKTPTQKVEKFVLRNAGVNARTWDAEGAPG